MHTTNEFGQPIGQSLANWQPAKLPDKDNLIGSYCLLEPLNSDNHAKVLFEVFQLDASGWTYLPYGPFAIFALFSQWLNSMANDDALFMYAILDVKTRMPLGLAGYMRINQDSGTIELGHVHFSKKIKQTRIATEAMYLLIQQAFEGLGYRRCEWKCDSLNDSSQKAAQRLGFTFEGIFRQDRIYKKRSRDTAWFSIIDSEWPSLEARFQRWLNIENFDQQGNQKLSLKSFINIHESRG